MTDAIDSYDCPFQCDIIEAQFMISTPPSREDNHVALTLISEELMLFCLVVFHHEFVQFTSRRDLGCNDLLLSIWNDVDGKFFVLNINGEERNVFEERPEWPKSMNDSTIET